MKFQKLFVAALLGISLLGFSSFAHAGVMEDIKAAYPKIKIETKVTQNAVGAEIVKKGMTIYKNKEGLVDLEIRLLEMDNVKYALLDVYFHGTRWAFLDYVTVGDGNSLIVLEPATKPSRTVSGGSVYEYMVFETTLENLRFMKNAKIIRAVSKSKGYLDVKYKVNKKNTVPFDQAIDYAIKFLNE